MSEQLSFILDQLSALPALRSRAMFGGHGLYSGTAIFGMVIDGQTYLKVGDSNRPDFEARGSKPFTYAHKSGKAIAMSYWEVPDEVLDDRDELLSWARASLRVAGEKAKSPKATNAPKATKAANSPKAPKATNSPKATKATNSPRATNAPKAKAAKPKTAPRTKPRRS